jgi:hypothetical protein
MFAGAARQPRAGCRVNKYLVNGLLAKVVEAFSDT